MDYSTVRTVALSYSDRENDTELLNRVDNFLRIVEARVNRALTTQKMVMRTSLTTIADQEYYGLPLDFEGMRDVEIRAQDNDGKVAGDRVTLTYLTPEQMNDRTFSQYTAAGFYTIAANQLQLFPAQDNMIMEMLYYRKLPELTETTPSNWMSEGNPDVYVFGIMVEICAFVKNGEAKALWDARFKEALAEIEDNDKDTRWSGAPLQVWRS